MANFVLKDQSRTAQAMEEFLAKGGKIKKIPENKTPVISLFTLQKREEKQLGAQADRTSDDILNEAAALRAQAEELKLQAQKMRDRINDVKYGQM
jgi:hypothetical protein